MSSSGKLNDAMSRCIGRDVVVAALLLSSTSCSVHNVKVLAETVDAEVTAPVSAKIKRTKKDSVHTPGCGCTGGGGGRGAVPLPSCSESHCTTQHFVYDSCDVVVRRDDKDAVASTACATDKPLELALDPQGARFATREKPDGGWSYFAGGWGGGLFRWNDGAIGLGTKEKTSPPGAPDWAKAPSALEILFQRANDSLGKIGREEERLLNEKILLNVARLDPNGLADHFAKLSKLDASSERCHVRKTAWVKLAREADAAQRKKLVGLLAPSLDLESPGREDVRDLLHYLSLVDNAELLRNVGDPARFVAKHADAAPDASAAVLDAWSRTTPGPAATFACSKLLSWSEGYVVMAGLWAIARAKLKCPAVDRVRTLACIVHEARPGELDEPMSKPAVEAKIEAADEWAYTCENVLGYIGALAAQPGEPPSGETISDRCWPRRASSTEDGDGDGASPRDARSDGSD